MCIIAAEKKALRCQVQKIEAQMTQGQRMSSDAALQRQFLSLPEVKQAASVLLYASMGKEIETAPILEELRRQGKRVLLPCCMPGHEMVARVYDPMRGRRHPYGMWEPSSDCEAVSADEIDLILVPGVCYDRAGMRLGRGGGYYDRYLIGYQGVSVGWCREALMQSCIPAEPWDQRVSLVLTEQETIGC